MKLDIGQRDKRKLAKNIIFIINIILFLITMSFPELIFEPKFESNNGFVILPCFLFTLYVAVGMPLLLGGHIIDLLKKKDKGFTFLGAILYPALTYLVLSAWGSLTEEMEGLSIIFLMVIFIPLYFIVGLVSAIVESRRNKIKP